MSKEKKIADLPSYKKTHDNFKGAHTVGKVIKALNFLGIKDKGLNDAFSKLPNLKDVENIISLPDRFNSQFAKIGWIAHESMNSTLIEKAVDLAESGQKENAEIILAEHFTSTEIKWLQHRFRVLPAFSIRFELIEQAYKDTLEERFKSCVPLLLTIIDGAVNDISKSKGFFSENTELKAWDSIASHSSGLSAIKEIFNAPRKKTNTEEIFLPYRNGILHGRDLKFDNKHVVGKCWSTLFAINDWARALKEEKENPPILPIEPTSISESWNEIRKVITEYQEWKVQSDTKWKELENWKPREEISIELADFKEFSPEKTALEIIESWKKKNYGRIAQLIHRISDKEINIGVEAGKVRRDLENKKLNSFQVKSISDKGAHASEITINIDYDLNGENKMKEIVIRLICTDKNGEMGMNGKENMTWEFIDNFFSTLDF
ncbi:hypothetical protein H0I23_08160 [Cellulophaga sp. HaHaR_3_176]|uniref:hypothetical protein n=1 Tax=Cellulophaga sp. HaHaR_3_176 TaxID=1942464 RepID=UPI001C1FD8E8|nr:hypothetical protein [Cellulophaga sp. HaHaR_3_176]QWX85601.1 hypothetical protein H0I23_08160 [Cellulophaga sp. HaHaR_3_176]